MNPGLILLCGNAAAVAFIHTLLGPDHYIPFVAMARARRWTVLRTAGLTAACGLGHVGTSVAVSLVAVAGGLEFKKLAHIETVWAAVATWALMAFGAIYCVWGMRHAARSLTHAHSHAHVDGKVHHHLHAHDREHGHVHDQAASVSLTPWVLFTLLVFGPCESAIPLIMYPALGGNWLGLVLVALVFAAVTIATMTAVVMLSMRGVQCLAWSRVERYSHALAGAAILLTGCAIHVFEL